MKSKNKTLDDKLILGRNECCELPELRIPMIRAKIDTGAKTSCIHAFDQQLRKENHKEYIYFSVHPVQSNEQIIIRCKAPLIGQRNITSSSGHKECRYVISTSLKIADQSWPIELTLSNRDQLTFRMLLGREALNKHSLIDPSLNYNQFKLTKKEMLGFYTQHLKTNTD